MEQMVKARIRRWADGTIHIEAQRNKFKHWFELGEHRETDARFETALAAGSVCWETRIVDPVKLF